MKLFTVLILTFCYSGLFSQLISEHLKIETVFVEGGSFKMGSPNNEKYRSNDEIRHTVNVKSFYISTTEITIGQYIKFMNDVGLSSDGSYEGVNYVDMNDRECAIEYKNGSFYFLSNNFIENKNFPMTEVTWAGAVAYTKNAGGRLPTEAEWEYAARGGLLSRAYLYAGSDTIKKVAVYMGTSKRKLRLVATMKPNEAGLFDMSGSVWEWCYDWYGAYNLNVKINPVGPDSGMFRVIRGGSWNTYAEDCRVAYRGNRNPASTGIDCGFRIVYDK